MDRTSVILIRNGEVREVGIKPSHEEIERLLGTTFWVVRRMRNSVRGVMFHGEGAYPGLEDFVFNGVPYFGNGVIAGYDEYGDIRSPVLTVSEVRKMVTFRVK